MKNERRLLTNLTSFEWFVAEIYGFQTTNHIFRHIIVVRFERDTYTSHAFKTVYPSKSARFLSIVTSEKLIFG